MFVVRVDRDSVAAAVGERDGGAALVGERRARRVRAFVPADRLVAAGAVGEAADMGPAGRQLVWNVPTEARVSCQRRRLLRTRR
jgi:hypothetical protein